MVKDISSLGGLPPNSGARTNSNQTAKVEQDTSSTSNTSVASASDKVELSSQAHNLQAAEELVQSHSGVDENRVAEVKAALASNSLVIDNHSIAEKMLATEALF